LQRRSRRFRTSRACLGRGSPKHFRSAKLRDVRSWYVPDFRKYLILYRPIPQGIEVLAIVHGARQLTRVLRERNP
jgi:hypothetical protein